jgi:hypothetical protein
MVRPRSYKPESPQTRPYNTAQTQAIIKKVCGYMHKNGIDCHVWNFGEIDFGFLRRNIVGNYKIELIENHGNMKFQLLSVRVVPPLKSL